MHIWVGSYSVTEWVFFLKILNSACAASSLPTSSHLCRCHSHLLESSLKPQLGFCLQALMTLFSFTAAPSFAIAPSSSSVSNPLNNFHRPPQPCSCATRALAFPCHLLEQAALPFLPCCSIKWWKSCWWTAAMLPSHFPLEYSFEQLLCQKSWQCLGSWCAGWLPLLCKLLSLFLRTRPTCPSQFIKHTPSYIEMAKPQGQGSSFLCLFCTMVSTTAVAKYHCGTNKITK